jgi:hypothetical protein
MADWVAWQRPRDFLRAKGFAANGEIVGCGRLGGLLKYYHRSTA